jgi:hypothetical protein
VRVVNMFKKEPMWKKSYMKANWKGLTKSFLIFQTSINHELFHILNQFGSLIAKSIKFVS